MSIDATPILPPEIVDIIIGRVKGYRSLLACCLVAHHWLPASRHNLFQFIYASSEAAYGLLVSRVLHSDNMRKYLQSTRRIYLYDPNPPYWDTGFKFSLQQNERSSLSAASRLFLCEFAGHLQNLTELSMIDIKWPNSLALRSEPLLLARYPSLERLRLERCRFPSVSYLRRALAALPCLRDLSMSNVSYSSEPIGPLILTRHQLTRPQLTRFSFTYTMTNEWDSFQVDALVAWLHKSPSTSSIRILSISIGARRFGPRDAAITYPDVSLTIPQLEFLKAVAPCVSHLTVSVAAMENFPISRYLHLSDLTVQASRGNGSTAWQKSINLLRQLRCRIRFLSLLPIFTRELRPPRQGSQSRAVYIDDLGLEELDTLIAPGEPFKDLQEILFCVYSTPAQAQSAEYQQEIKESMLQRLPQLHARKLITVEVAGKSPG
ncbi:hypothetical protein C8Q76DRAFT_725110 [Earliella scabrosa]|nr:hypothetical protein C8Q76DRAFT_725110 [Earliella scabrosa]